MSLTTIITSSAVGTRANSTATGLLPFTPESSSVLTSTSSSLPGAGESNCYTNSFQTIPNAFPACAMQTVGNISVVPIMTDCCNGAPQIRYNSGCHIYCEARNQTARQLHDCMSDGLRSRQGSIGLIPILCNRNGESYSSLLPANTQDPATRTTPTGSPTGNAAVRSAVAGEVFPRDAKLLSAGVWATVLVLAVSGLASFTV